MSKDFLRLKNHDEHDSSVNKYSAKSHAKRKVNQRGENSAIGLLIDEVYDYQSKSLISEEYVKKPKILDSIVFSFIYLAVLMLLLIFVSASTSIFSVFVLAIVSALFIPTSFVYFFYRLDARGKLRFSSVVYYFVFGFISFLIIKFAFDKIISLSTDFYFYAVTIKCIVELIVMITSSVLLVKTRANCSRTTAILITSAVASGYALAEALSNNLYAMLISVEVHQFGSTVGALINVSSFVNASAENLISQLSTTSFLNSLLLVMLAVIITDIITTEDVPIGRRTITTLFTFLFCCMTYVLTKINTPFNTLAILYDALSLGCTLYLFARMINSCIREEKYE